MMIYLALRLNEHKTLERKKYIFVSFLSHMTSLSETFLLAPLKILLTTMFNLVKSATAYARTNKIKLNVNKQANNNNHHHNVSTHY